jgi:uncharacterized iron-regulated membrane protein
LFLCVPQKGAKIVLMKVFFRRIHLYLSLVSGLVLMITCFTGAVLVFEKEMQETFNHDRYYVTPTGAPLPLDQVIASLKEQVPGGKVSRIQVFADPTRSLLVTIEEGKKKGKGGEKGVEQDKGAAKGSAPVAAVEKGGDKGDKDKGGAAKKEGGRGGGKQAYVNPYTGKVIEFYNYQKTWYFTMFSLHRWLLGGDIGKLVVGVSTLIFLFIITTGIILWWPKTRNILMQRLKLKWDGGWKRLNHDLHIVLGFYAAIFLFIFSFTGLAWSFEWFNKGIYTVTNSPMQPPKPPTSVAEAGKQPISFDVALQQVQSKVPDAVYYSLMAPKDTAAAFMVTFLPADAGHEAATTSYYLDQYSGTLLSSQTFAERNLGQRVRSSFKPIHTGSIFGLPSKIIAFITCLLGVTFPVTGVIMWLNRIRKKKKGSSIDKKRTAEPVMAA